MIVGWSAGAEDLLGYPASEVLEHPVGEFLLATDLPVEPNSGGRVSDRERSEASVVVRHRDGHAEACSLWLRAGSESQPSRWTVRLVAASPSDREMDLAVLAAMYSASPVGLYVYDPDLRLRRYNPAAEGMERAINPRPLGMRPSQIWPHSNADAFEAELEIVLTTGAPLLNFDKHGFIPGDPYGEHIFSLSAFRLLDHAGRVIGVAHTAVEITSQRMAEQRLALLADASALIGTELDVLRTGQQLADVSVPRFADAVTVDILDPVLGGEDPGPDPDISGLRRIGLQSSQGPAADTTDPLGDSHRFPFLPTADRCLRATEPVVLHLELPADDGEPLRSGTAEGRTATALVMPLRARGAVLGLTTFYRLGEHRTFEEADIVTALDLSSRAAVCVDNARRFTREHVVARALQRELLPSRFPRQSAVDTAHSFVATGTGADWYDVLPLSGTRVALVVGAMTGGGLSATAAMGRLRASVHTLAELDLDPDEVLARLQALVTRISAERRGMPVGTTGRPDGEVTGATCLYAVYDPTSGHLTLASAGHPVPVVVHPDGTTHTPGVPSGGPLGTGGSPFGTAELELPPGTTLAFYTPGLLASGDPDRLLATLTAFLSSAGSASLQDLCADATEKLVAKKPEHDAVLLLARTHRLGEDQVATWDLPSDPAIVATVRALVERQLVLWHMQEQIFPTQLIASELVTNAIRHAEGPIQLRLLHDRDLICEVSDGSTTAPHLRYARAGDEGGRGLFLTSQLTQRWGTRYSANGKTIWTSQIQPDEDETGDEDGTDDRPPGAPAA